MRTIHLELPLPELSVEWLVRLRHRLTTFVEELRTSLTKTFIKKYTPSGSGDGSGKEGDKCWDDDYLYVKTATGWKRVALSSF